MQEEYEEELERVVSLIRPFPTATHQCLDYLYHYFKSSLLSCRNVLGACKAFSTGRGTNLEGALRIGRKMILMLTNTISSIREMIGTGKLSLPLETKGPITRSLQNRVQESIHYRITTLF